MTEYRLETKAACRTGRLAVVCAAAACWLSGCQSVEMAHHGLPRQIPPQGYDGFEAPTSFGHFPTLWRAWPGAEVSPGTGGEVVKTPTEAQTDQDTLPPPSEEGDTGLSTQNLINNRASLLAKWALEF